MSSRKPLQPENQNYQDEEDSCSLSSLYGYLSFLCLFFFSFLFALENITSISLIMKEEQLHLLHDIFSCSPVKQEIARRPYRT